MKILPIVKSEHKPFVIAGPCSVESKEQIFSIAEELKSYKEVKMFRCGVWKPRSSPNTFEGLGEKALPWLQQLQQNYAIPICIEVGTPQHLEMAMKYDIRCFWIGARTSVNPFLVQEIAQSSKGCDIAMMIKNPVMADIKLWYGNFERFYKSGINKMAAIFRGFSSQYAFPYRNEPAWSQLFEFMRLDKHIPIIFDPSHIAGKNTLVEELTQKAIYLNVNGLMVEVHAKPSEALSDNQQQLNFEQFRKLIGNLCYLQADDNQTNNALLPFRLSIDEIDKELVSLLAKRNAIVEEIALYKKKNHVPILQMDRWQTILQNVHNDALQQGVSPELVEQILHLIHEDSVKRQQQIIVRSE